ncbi:MAG: hypothetical protein HY297_04315, partial [Thaumarchaeota archaeon]|nr:hypothetical protein [Nitrososphaerota archaeon]
MESKGSPRHLTDPILLSASIYASILGLMAMGLTLTYLTTKVPNFAYGSFVAEGIYLSFAISKVYHLNAYYSIPFCFVV